MKLWAAQPERLEFCMLMTLRDNKQTVYMSIGYSNLTGWHLVLVCVFKLTALLKLQGAFDCPPLSENFGYYKKESTLYVMAVTKRIFAEICDRFVSEENGIWQLT